MLDTTYFDTMIATPCSECGIKFGLPSTFIARRREDHKTFHCPNGHCLHFGGPSTSEREAAEAKRNADHLRVQLGLALTARNRALHDRQLAEKREKRVKAKLKSAETRVHAGVCPHCNRTFQALARHMSAKHSEEKR